MEFDVSIPAFLLVTLFLGGGAAWLTGRATAHTWSAWWKLVVYIGLLTVAARFIHFSLFGGTFFLPLEDFPRALFFAAIDFVVLMALAVAGRLTARRRQMATQYGFLFERSGVLDQLDRT